MKRRDRSCMYIFLFFVPLYLFLDIYIFNSKITLANAQNVRYSDLWGMNGELWDSSSRLPDFSFAGYRSGRATNSRESGAN